MVTEWLSNVNQLHSLTSHFTFSKLNGRPSSLFNSRLILRIFSITKINMYIARGNFDQ